MAVGKVVVKHVIPSSGRLAVTFFKKTSSFYKLESQMVNDALNINE